MTKKLSREDKIIKGSKEIGRIFIGELFGAASTVIRETTRLPDTAISETFGHGAKAKRKKPKRKNKTVSGWL